MGDFFSLSLSLLVYFFWRSFFSVGRCDERERERFWGELESVGHDDMQARHHAIHPKREKTFTQRERSAPVSLDAILSSDSSRPITHDRQSTASTAPAVALYLCVPLVDATRGSAG